MTESLKLRLLSIDRFKPYVWKLRLTKDEYDQLQTYVTGYNGAMNQEYAILAIIYIAEWYKRDYDGNVAKASREFPAKYPQDTLKTETGSGANN